MAAAVLSYAGDVSYPSKITVPSSMSLSLVPSARFEHVAANEAILSRKAAFEHFYPQSLIIILAKHALMQAAKLMSADVPPSVPWSDRVLLAKFAFEHLRWPVLKDLLIASTARCYEYLLVDVIYAEDRLAGARFLRDIGIAAQDSHALALRKHETERKATLLAAGSDPHTPMTTTESLVVSLRARTDAALYVFLVTPYPSLVANAAYLTVEEAALITQFAYRRNKRIAAEAVLADPNSSHDDVTAAHMQLVENEERAGSSLLHDSVELLVRAGSSVVCEAVFAATGTFLYPGIGSKLLSLVGSVVCWII